MGHKNNKKPAVAETIKPVITETNNVQNENKVETPVKEDIAAKQITHEEQAILSRVNRPKKDWNTISEEEMVDFNLGKNLLELPPEAKKLQDNKEYAFSWVERKPKRIDEVENYPPPMTWWVVNRTLCPELAYLCDPMTGGIHTLDQILVMKPWKLHKRYQDVKLSDAIEKDRSGTLEGKHGQKEELEPGVVRTEYVSGAKIDGGDVVMATDT